MNRVGRSRVSLVAGLGLGVAVVLALGGARGSVQGPAHAAGAAQSGPGQSIDVTVSEGTSMSVAVSPDGRTLVIDLQGSLWTLPVSGGAATRITDLFNDARQPVWSPDGRTIAFQGYRDGTFDIWAVDPDGSNLRKLTHGPYDHREPAWSPDGAAIAFSADRKGNYDIFTLDLRSGRIRRLTTHEAHDYMPSWSPDGREIAFVSARGGDTAVWAVSLDGFERRVAGADGRVDAPSWGPGGEIVYHVTGGDAARLLSDGRALTVDEIASPFRVSWLSATEFVYTGDGKIRRRPLSGGSAQTIEFTATLPVTPASYTKRSRDVDSRAPRRALGIVRPAISPDGTQVALSALGNIYLLDVGGRPEPITNDAYLDTEPAWSPDGSQLVFASDRGGSMNLWVRDMVSGELRPLTHLPTAPMSPSWSPDGRRVAFINISGPWRGNVAVVDVATGHVEHVTDTLFGPGTPTWSPDSRRLALTLVQQYSTRFREGQNQIMTLSAEGGGEQWHVPVEHMGIDSRVGGGPAWSPDGTRMAVVMEGLLHILPVARDGRPLGPPRRITSEMAHAPSWTADSASLLYLSMDRLRLVSLETGETRDVPLDLQYTPAVPAGRMVVHAGRLVDMRTDTIREDVDILIEGNRIRAVEPHRPNRRGQGTLVDASDLTVMPGLIEFHTHLMKDHGEPLGRAWLAHGITTVRNPSGTPYEVVEDREAVDAGVRIGPRVYAAGYLLEWNRVYYPMGVPISSGAHLDLELERARMLQHDLLKSYVRMPDLYQKRIVEFGHGIGIPTATHEIYPAAFVGMDHTEHTGGTSRRGYSPKNTSLSKSYDDVAQIFGAARMTLTPTTALGGFRRMLEREPDLPNDPRFALYPSWVRESLTAQAGGGGFQFPTAARRHAGEMIINVQRAGGRIVAGTDSPFMPFAISLHGEMESYVEAGMTPYEALRTATVNPADALGLPAGTIEAGRLADLVIVDGNPLDNLADARKVRQVIANGRLFDIEELIGAPSEAAPTAAP